MSTIQNTNDLLSFLFQQSQTRGDWFGYTQQKMTGIKLCHEIAARHADIMSPQDVVKYVVLLNKFIYSDLIMGQQ
jgi:hypothetical protein